MQCASFDRLLVENLLKDYNTDVRPVENTSQVLEISLGLQPYRLLRVVSAKFFFAVSVVLFVMITNAIRGAVLQTPLSLITSVLPFR